MTIIFHNMLLKLRLIVCLHLVIPLVCMTIMTNMSQITVQKSLQHPSGGDLAPH